MSLKEGIRNIASYIMGLAVLAAMMVLFGTLLFGIAKVSAVLYPVFTTLASIAILVFIFAVLPLSLIKPLRHTMAITSVILSMICSATVWMYSFLMIWYFAGAWALFLLFIFQVVYPIAIIALLIKGAWAGVGSIIVGLLIAFGMKLFGFWLEEKHTESQYTVDYYTPQQPINKNLPKYCPKCGRGYDNSWGVCLHCGEPLADINSVDLEITE